MTDLPRIDDATLARVGALVDGDAGLWTDARPTEIAAELGIPVRDAARAMIAIRIAEMDPEELRAIVVRAVERCALEGVLE